jgi:DNA-binding transcriptional LysR family regulator
MDLKRLRYFVAVAEELHFGRAAEKLHMAQPPLSHQIRRLEADLGLTLFDRTTRRVELTPAGSLLLDEARRLLVAAESVERVMDENRTGLGGLLRLGFVDSSAYEVMPTFLRAYRRRWPGVDLDLHSMSSDEQLDALLAGEIDLGINRALGDRTDVRSVLVLRERLHVAVDPGHRLAAHKTTSLARLAGEPFIGFDRRVSPTLHAEMVAMLGAVGVAYDPIIEATEYTTILGLVAAGEGLAVVPDGVRLFARPDVHYALLRDSAAAVPLVMSSRLDERLRLVDNAFVLMGELFG